MITEKQKEAVQELCRYVENFCKENDLSAFMIEPVITGKGEYVVGAISGTVKADSRVYMLLSMALMQAYTRKTDINTIPFGENLNMN